MKEYVQIIKGHYDDNGAVKAIDILNDKPLTADYMKTRPDIKQRVEKAFSCCIALTNKLSLKYVPESLL